MTKLVLKRPVSAFLVVCALIIFGISSIMGSPMELMPDMDMPVMLVMTAYPGAGPEDVEELVSKEIEDTVSTLSGVKNVTAYSQENMSMVMLEFNYGENMDVAHMDLQEKLNMISNNLPDDATSPTIMEMSMDMMPVIAFSVEKLGDIDILSYVDQEIKPEFEKLSGVAQVEIYGGEENYISVQLNEERMNQYKLDINTLAQIVGSADFSMPAGSVDRGDLSLALRGGVSYRTTESLKNIPITLSSGQVIHLSDVAQIFESKKDASSISRYNGKENVGLTITKRQSASTVDVTRAAVRTAEQINRSGKGIHLEVVFDSSESILASVKTVFTTLGMGIILSMIVLFIFFGDWKASIIVGSSMPVSVLLALILMHTLGFSLNMLSLGGLVIGVGMMVDNSIVVLESCFRMYDQRRNFEEAALEGTKIVTASIISGTLTTVVVYLPISILQGMSGQLFKQLGFTIIFSLSASLFSAMTLVPLLFCKMKPKEKKEMPINKLLAVTQRGYGSFLKMTFRVKPLVVLISVALLVGSIWMVASGAIPFELIPQVDQGQIDIAIETRPGLKLEVTNALLQDIEEMVTQSSDVERYSLQGQSGSATVSVYLKDNRERKTSDWVDIWREQTKNRVDCDISVSMSSSGMGSAGGSNDVQIPLQGNDYELLQEASKQVEDVMRSSPNIVRVTNSVSSGSPQAEIVVDPIKAGAVGLTPRQVIGTVYTTINGTSPDSMRLNGQDYDITLEYPKGRFQSVSDLSGMMLTSPAGRQVPLLDIAEITYSNSPQQIQRKNNQYIVTVTGQPTTAARLTAGSEIRQAVNQLEFPQGVSIGMGSNDESMQEEFGALLSAIATAVLLVFLVMAMQFESIRFSVIVMICIPFSLIGAFGGLLATRCSLSMPAMMGLLTLVGTVINSGILYIDTANQYRSSMDAQTALITAGRTRLRPILMTTLTTILAMIPMAIGYGDNGEVMQGMAIIIVGGLTASTILSLLLLPTFYLLFGGDKKHRNPHDMQKKKHRWGRKKKEQALQLEGHNREQNETEFDNLFQP